MTVLIAGNIQVVSIWGLLSLSVCERLKRMGGKPFTERVVTVVLSHLLLSFMLHNWLQALKRVGVFSVTKDSWKKDLENSSAGSGLMGIF